MYPDNTAIQKDTCALMFVATLFTIAKTQKRPKCPPTAEWIKKWHAYIHIGILLRRKKEGNNAVCSNTEGPTDHHTK